MNDFDIPIFKKAYELYKIFSDYRRLIPKHHRFSVGERCENIILDILEGIMISSRQSRKEKLPTLERVSTQINFLRILIRLMKDIQALDTKKYAHLSEITDEIGRMLGGWLKSIRDT